MRNLKISIVSSERTSNMSLEEKIDFILEGIEDNQIIVLEEGLNPREESKLYERTMERIDPDKFSGIEIQGIRGDITWYDKVSSFFGLANSKTAHSKFTVIGPAESINVINRGPEVVSFGTRSRNR